MRKYIFYLLFLLICSETALSQVAVIANESVPVDELSSTQVLDYYTGDIRAWEDGQRIVVYDLKVKGRVKDTFYDFIGKTPSRMKSIWMKNLLSGEGGPPESLESEQSMLEKVKATPGAIGFVAQDKAGIDVKILVTIEFIDED